MDRARPRSREGREAARRKRSIADAASGYSGRSSEVPLRQLIASCSAVEVLPDTAAVLLNMLEQLLERPSYELEQVFFACQ